MPKQPRPHYLWVRIIVAVIILAGAALAVIGTLTSQLFSSGLGAVLAIVPFLVAPHLRSAVANHPRPTIAGLLCILGVLFLAYLTPIFGPIFVTQPNTGNVNRLVFSVTWLPLNNAPQTAMVTFDTVNSQLSVSFLPNGFNDKLHQNVSGILYVAEPFKIIDMVYPNLVGNSKFGNWSFGFGSQVFSPGGSHVRLDYTFTNYTLAGFPCRNNGGNCEMSFDTEQMTRNDLNGAVSMEIQTKPLNGGSINLCGALPCSVTSRNMTVNVSVVIPHDTSSLQTSPMATNPSFNQRFTSLEWDNLTSAIFLSYISPQKLAQYQFFILTSGILISTGVAMGMDSIAKWAQARNRSRQILSNQWTD